MTDPSSSSVPGVSLSQCGGDSRVPVPIPCPCCSQPSRGREWGRGSLRGVLPLLWLPYPIPSPDPTFLPPQDHALEQLPDGKRTFIPAALSSQQVLHCLILFSPSPQALPWDPWGGGGPGDPWRGPGTPLGRRRPLTPPRGPPLEGSLSSLVPAEQCPSLSLAPAALSQPVPALLHLGTTPGVPPAPEGSPEGSQGVSLSPNAEGWWRRWEWSPSGGTGRGTLVGRGHRSGRRGSGLGWGALSGLGARAEP